MAEAVAGEAPQADEHVTSMRMVVAASCASTAFEWYDFFVFGSLLTIISKNFFSQLGPTAGQIAALALFGVGFAFRPLGALIFGRVGDRFGRKAAFLICVSIMAGATFGIGLLPTAAQAPALAPVLLILLRILQGTALGGQYGGAAIYVAEHASPARRGFATGWVQTSAAFGLIAALSVIFITRRTLGETAFSAATWTGGWRIPFFVSIGLVAISIWMRSKLSESPAFQKMRAAGGASRAPYAEAFARWPNLRLVLIAFFALMCVQGAYWYTVFFYADVFMERFLKVEGDFANLVIMTAAIISAPLYVFFGWLSDKVGRKPVMWAAMVLGLVTLYPGFQLLAAGANPALVDAVRHTPVTVVADPADCSSQFDLTGKTKFLSSCDIVKAALTNSGVSYTNRPGPAGRPAVVRIGAATIASLDARRLPAPAQKAATAKIAADLSAALKAGGYPAKSDPSRRNPWLILAVMTVFTVAATGLYGPQAAALTELFPTRVRYTAMSLPYHLGTGWIGGFQPVMSFSIVVATGNIYAGLWYPIVFTAISVVAALLFLPETRGRVLTE
ncbi:MAG TPA: MFS transporter [Caulobacteraceae bacterium]|nr:MFS transporter [Caulobacteraceae bacterium]